MDAKTRPFKKGMIILWSGLIADIPGGWALCDGTNGTPNLENVFVVGAGDTYVVNATGGGLTHTHVLPGSGHDHEIPVGSAIAGGAEFAALSALGYAEGTTQTGSTMPPYRALAYIMKL